MASKSTPAPMLKLPAGMEDSYAELELQVGASDDAISKRYKQLARKYHPDKMVKASDAAKAVAETHFLRIKTAHDFLVDAVQKTLFDEDVAKKKRSAAQKAEREGAMDERRKAMKRRLDEGERHEAERRQERHGSAQKQQHHQQQQQRSVPSNQQRARAADLRQENRARRETAGEAQFSREQAAAFSTAAASAASAERASLELRTLSLKWKRRVHAFGDDDVAALFLPFGLVQDVRLVGDKGNAAVVVLESPEAAAAAAAALGASETLKVAVVGEKARPLPAWASPAAPTPSPAARPLSARDRESLDDFNVRRAAERERFSREMLGSGEAGGKEAGTSEGKPGGVPVASAGWVPRAPLSEDELLAKEHEVFGFLLAAEGSAR